MKSKTKQSLDIQGHRGCRGSMPENTLPGFLEAIKMGVTTLELDVVISKDHKVVVSHEPYMNHEFVLDSNGNEISEDEELSFNLYKMDYCSILQFDCGSKLHPRYPDQKKFKVSKPLLFEVIQMAEKAKDKNIRYNIEIKSLPEYDGIYTPKVKDFVKLVLEVIKSEDISKRVILQSFDVRALEEIHKLAPEIEISLLVNNNESIDEKLSTITFKPEIIGPYFELLDKTFVQTYQSLNFRVIPWTVNENKDIQKMIDFKVDGIISDYPERVFEVYNSPKRL